MAQAWYSPISINAAQVPSTQTDFPVLVSQIDNRFKTIGNGGHVSDANGYDIRPYTDTSLGTAITGYELERYNATTGEVIMWVKVGSLSSSTTPIVLGYGDASLNTNGSSTTTWSNSFVAIVHLADGTTLSLNESKTNTNLTNNNGVTAATGQIDGCGAFASASSQNLSFGPTIVTAFTLSAWVKATSFPTAYNAVFTQRNGALFKLLEVNSSGKLSCFLSATSTISYDGTGSHTLSTGTWYLIHMSYDSTAGLIGYVNAASDNTSAANGSAQSTSTTEIGHDVSQVGRYWNGSLDEIRASSVARSADWITTEYNNQSAPGTFETLGSEVAVGASATGNMFLLFP